MRARAIASGLGPFPVDARIPLAGDPHGMRQFLVLGHDAPVTPEFPLDDLPGAAGRLDVLCRCVTAALLISHDIRRDVRVWLVLRDRLTIRFEGASIKRLNPDERSTAALIRHALEAAEEAVGHLEVESTPGVHVSNRGLDAILERVVGEGPVLQLHEAGRPIVDVDVPVDPTFVISDHRDPETDEQDRLDDVLDDRLRVGPRSLHANQAITVTHNWLDTEGFQVY